MIGPDVFRSFEGFAAAAASTIEGRSETILGTSKGATFVKHLHQEGQSRRGSVEGNSCLFGEGRGDSRRKCTLWSVRV